MRDGWIESQAGILDRNLTTLLGVHAVVRMAGSAGLAALRWASREGFNLPAAAKIAVGVVALLVPCSAEVRRHLGLRLDAIVTATAIWGSWRWCLRGAAMTI